LIIRRPKISYLIELVKIFWASHSSTVDVWWVINPKPCKKRGVSKPCIVFYNIIIPNP